MKTAKELRELCTPELAGNRLFEQMALEAESYAEKGCTTHKFLMEKNYTTDVIDFAISELVALGFSVDKGKGSELYDHYIIKW